MQFTVKRQKTYDHDTSLVAKSQLLNWEAKAKEENGKRYYQLPNGEWVPSITTILGVAEKPELEEWRKRVGYEESEKIKKKAGERGTLFHNTMEKYLKNEPMENVLLGLGPQDIKQLKDCMVYLNRIGTVFAQEQPLYSYAGGLAGRCDCIADFDGHLSIIDFKTSLRPKQEGWIEDYFIQATAYAMMFTPIKRVIQTVIIMVNDESLPQIFIKKHPDVGYVHMLMRRIKEAKLKL